ncbi:RNA and export factor binding protein, putative [Plasmodium ovale curtisi]|uniref:RNA and export factor binding protein, putative n=1 Tax=Plasmodium ovale curtisi TaxID=864141 RepID=A0A1A8WP29_PLAOA|nr:RNA and export factor binding protein, putative [Plasmodium ovale curtisi]
MAAFDVLLLRCPPFAMSSFCDALLCGALLCNGFSFPCSPRGTPSEKTLREILWKEEQLQRKDWEKAEMENGGMPLTRRTLIRTPISKGICTSNEYRTNHEHGGINKHGTRHAYNNYEERKKDMERNSQVRVKISNLDYTISKNDLVELFSNVCTVVNAWINYDHTDRSDGTAVCIFENINDAQKAIDKYDG